MLYCLFRLSRKSPAQAKRNRPVIKLALNGITSGTLIKPKDLVGHIQQRDDCLRPMPLGNPVAHLGVNLRVGIEICIPVRPFESAIRTIGGGVAIAEDVGVVMGYTNASGEPFLVVGQVEVGVVGRLAQQCGTVCPAEIEGKVVCELV